MEAQVFRCFRQRHDSPQYSQNYNHRKREVYVVSYKRLCRAVSDVTNSRRYDAIGGESLIG